MPRVSVKIPEGKVWTKMTQPGAHLTAQGQNVSWGYGAWAEGKVLFLGGAVALDNQGLLVGKGNLQTQLVQAMENVEIVLEAAGAMLEDIVFVRTYTTDMDAYRKTIDWRTQTYPQIWGGENAAPSTILGVTRLGDPNLLVEIEVVAAVK